MLRFFKQERWPENAPIWPWPAVMAMAWRFAPSYVFPSAGIPIHDPRRRLLARHSPQSLSLTFAALPASLISGLSYLPTSGEFCMCVRFCSGIVASCDMSRHPVLSLCKLERFGIPASERTKHMPPVMPVSKQLPLVNMSGWASTANDAALFSSRSFPIFLTIFTMFFLFVLALLPFV